MVLSLGKKPATAKHTLPITVLFYEGPMARAYLATLFQAGFRVERIIAMVLDHHPGSKAKIPTWLPFRARIAAGIQFHAMQHWPRRLRHLFPGLYLSIVTELDRLYPNADVASVLEECSARTPLENYSDHVESLLCGGLKDPALKTKLESLGPIALLFTGGGIIPKTLFESTDLHWLHIHPGHLPYVRGADGVLWSLEKRNCPGASLFYMEPGLDTGLVICAADLPKPSFVNQSTERTDTQMLYRALFSYYDPLLRGLFLVDCIRSLKLENANWKIIPATIQDQNQAQVFRFMDAKTREQAIKLLFS